MNSKENNNEKRILVIETRLQNIEEKVSDIHKALMGNGRPGLIDQFNQYKGAVKIMAIILPLFATIVSYFL